MTAAELISLITLVVGVAVAVGGYVRFVLVRANVGAQFDIEFSSLGLVNGQPAGDMALVITNLGSNLLVVTRVSYRVKYATEADAGAPGHDSEPQFSASVMPSGWVALFGGPTLRKNALRRENRARRKAGKPKVVEPRSVISQGGAQAYRKPLTFPDGTGAAAIWGSCDYHVNIGAIERFLVRAILRPPADLDFTHGLDNHQVRRTFRIDSSPSGSAREPAEH